jgi:hypothetical protein
MHPDLSRMITNLRISPVPLPITAYSETFRRLEDASSVPEVPFLELHVAQGRGSTYGTDKCAFVWPTSVSSVTRKLSRNGVLGSGKLGSFRVVGNPETIRLFPSTPLFGPNARVVVNRPAFLPTFPCCRRFREIGQDRVTALADLQCTLLRRDYFTAIKRSRLWFCGQPPST